MRQLLNAYGLRPSAKRFAILTILSTRRDWISCEEVASAVAHEWPTTERASVSQCLCQLTEAELVESSLEGGVRRYRLAPGDADTSDAGLGG
jgi:Fe2+ or Zn2+ uptake regulation protein